MTLGRIELSTYCLEVRADCRSVQFASVQNNLLNLYTTMLYNPQAFNLVHFNTIQDADFVPISCTSSVGNSVSLITVKEYFEGKTSFSST